MHKILSFREKSHFEKIDKIMKDFTITEVSLSSDTIKNNENKVTVFDDTKNSSYFINPSYQQQNKIKICTFKFLDVKNKKIINHKIPIITKAQVRIPMEELRYNETVYNNTDKIHFITRKPVMMIGDRETYKIGKYIHQSTITFPKQFTFFYPITKERIIPIDRGIIAYDYFKLEQDIKKGKIKLEAIAMKKILEIIKSSKDFVQYLEIIDDISEIHPLLKNYIFIVLSQEIRNVISNEASGVVGNKDNFNILNYIVMRLESNKKLTQSTRL